MTAVGLVLACKCGGRPPGGEEQDRMYSVSEGSLLAANRCKWDFQCLRGEGCGDCRIERAVELGIARIKTEQPHSGCPYMVGAKKDAVFCVCPVRVELYRKYGI